MILYMVRRNADMTEGRGPMVEESFWFDRAKAVEHMDKQPGVFGRKPPSGSWDTEPHLGDWDIAPFFTMDELEEPETPEGAVVVIFTPNDSNPHMTYPEDRS